MSGKKQVIKLLSLQICCKLLCLLVLPLVALACHEPKTPVLLKAQEGCVQLKVDSILRWPEMASFPIRVRLSNYTDKKVALVFDTISNKYKHQVKNLFITSGKDTFNLGVRTSGMSLVFKEKTITSFNCEAYFIYGKGHFDSFGEIKSSLKEGTLVYKLGKKLINQAHLKGILSIRDTVLIPTSLEASTERHLWLQNFCHNRFVQGRNYLQKKKYVTQQ